jgi:hypothetical protein
MESDLLDFSISDSYGSKNTIGKFNITYNFEDEVLKLDFENPNQWASEKAYTYTGSNGKQFQLRGFLQLLNKRSFQGKFGLNLYCKGQLIERYHKKIDGLFSTAGRAAEKTYGELHLDGLNPDYVKSKGFIEDAAFKEVAKLIAKDLEFYKYLGIATNAANDRIKQEINKRKGIGGVIEPDFEDEDEDEEEIEGDEGENVETPEDPTEIEDENQKNVIVIDKKLKIEINAPYVNVNALDAKNKLSRECYYSKSRVDNNLWIIQVYLNPESALYKSFESLYDNYSDKNKAISLLKKITICESIFDKLISEHKYKEELARKITDLKVYPKVLKLNLS